MSDQPDRLDSWKAIAEYLDRDVRTLRRWERQGLPVHRVAGGRGNSVFAFRSEINAWLKTQAEPPAPAPAPATVPATVPASRPVTIAAVVNDTASERRAPLPMVLSRPRWRLIAATLIVIGTIVSWKALAPSAARQRLEVKVTSSSILVVDQQGAERWRSEFGPELRSTFPVTGQQFQVVEGERPAVFVASAFMIRQADEEALNGLLRWFSPDGHLQRTFSFNDQVTFAGRTYREPWTLTDFRVNDSYAGRRVAVAAHHITWWPSLVTLLDDKFQRKSTFVNAGWVESVRWLSPDRLVIGGFNQGLDGGMVAVLDANNIDGASPEAAGSQFACDACPPSRPLFYAVLPRSELNRVTGSQFNGAWVEIVGGDIVVHTTETPREPGMAEAIYEFSPSFELRSATYGGRYWDRHRVLELAGKLNHTRENCPERDGPPIIKVWSRDAGWTDVRTRR